MKLVGDPHLLTDGQWLGVVEIVRDDVAALVRYPLYPDDKAVVYRAGRRHVLYADGGRMEVAMLEGDLERDGVPKSLIRPTAH